MEKGLQHITHVWPEGAPNSPGTGGQDLAVCTRRLPGQPCGL